MSSINLPLILTLAVLITGLIWLFDVWVLSRPRKAKLAAVDKQFSGMALETEQQKEAFEQAKALAGKEPLLVEYSKSFFPVLFIVFFLRSFLVEPFQIPSGSMIPTLEVGDFILVNKFAYGVRAPVLNTEIIPVGKPKRGDVMVFFPPHQPETYYIKRVIGIPGDHISYNNHRLSVNGQFVEETLIAQLPVGAPVLRMTSEKIDDKQFSTYKHLQPSRLSVQGSWVVPAGHYFMMGDNRDNSLDSREWGMVSEDAIVGKAFAIWMHWQSFFSVPSFKRAGVIE